MLRQADTYYTFWVEIGEFNVARVRKHMDMEDLMTRLRTCFRREGIVGIASMCELREKYKKHAKIGFLVEVNTEQLANKHELWVHMVRRLRKDGGDIVRFLKPGCIGEHVKVYYVRERKCGPRPEAVRHTE